MRAHLLPLLIGLARSAGGGAKAAAGSLLLPPLLALLLAGPRAAGRRGDHRIVAAFPLLNPVVVRSGSGMDRARLPWHRRILFWLIVWRR